LQLLGQARTSLSGTSSTAVCSRSSLQLRQHKNFHPQVPNLQQLQ